MRNQEEAARHEAQQGEVEAEAVQDARESRDEAARADGAELQPGPHGEQSGAKKAPWESSASRRPAQAESSHQREPSTGGAAAAERPEITGGRGEALAGAQRGISGRETTKPDASADAWRRGGAAEAERASAVAAEVSVTGYAAAVASVAGPRLGPPVERAEKLPDALTLLKEAKEGGVLFHEDREGEAGGSEVEPELAEAVEECIRLCFGIRGILRVGPGRNEAGEPVIVVTAAPGLTDVGFGKIPPQVHRFTTLVAIPFEVLPLRREP